MVDWVQHPLRGKWSDVGGAEMERQVLGAAFCCGVFHDYVSLTLLHLTAQKPSLRTFRQELGRAVL